MLWLHTIEFFKPYPKMYSLVLTIRWGIPRVTAFLAGVFPVFIGFAVFGTIYFGNQVKGFDSVQVYATSILHYFYNCSPR